MSSISSHEVEVTVLPANSYALLHIGYPLRLGLGLSQKNLRIKAKVIKRIVNHGRKNYLLERDHAGVDEGDGGIVVGQDGGRGYDEVILGPEILQEGRTDSLG